MIHLLSPPVLETAKYYFLTSIFSSGERYPEHDHDFYEFFLVTSGRLRQGWNGRVSILEPGTIQFLHPNDRHWLECAPGCSSVRIQNCNILPSEVSRIFAQLTGGHEFSVDDCIQQLHPESFALRQYLIEEAESLCLLGNRPRQLAEARLRLLAETVLLQLFRHSKSDGDGVPLWLRDSYRAMHSYENFRIGLARFLELAGHSPEHLCRSMRRYYGITPQEFINELRLEYAFDQLLKRRDRISEIAYDSGFQNLSYFRRCFKRKYAASPRRIQQI